MPLRRADAMILSFVGPFHDQLADFVSDVQQFEDTASAFEARVIATIATRPLRIGDP